MRQRLSRCYQHISGLWLVCWHTLGVDMTGWFAEVSTIVLSPACGTVRLCYLITRIFEEYLRSTTNDCLVPTDQLNKRAPPRRKKSTVRRRANIYTASIWQAFDQASLAYFTDPPV